MKTIFSLLNNSEPFDALTGLAVGRCVGLLEGVRGEAVGSLLGLMDGEEVGEEVGDLLLIQNTHG